MSGTTSTQKEKEEETIFSPLSPPTPTPTPSSPSPTNEENGEATTTPHHHLVSDPPAIDTGGDDRGNIEQASSNDKKEKQNENNEEEGSGKQNPTEEEEQPPLDEEGLKRDGYDVILVGTGLVQSILASALTRAGRSVLHCDGNDFYGEKDAVFSLGSLMDWSNDSSNREKTGSSQGNSGNDGDNVTNDMGSIRLRSGGALSSIQIHSESRAGPAPVLEAGMSVVTPYGQGVVRHLPAINGAGVNHSAHKSLAVELNNWTMANGKSPTAYFGYHNCSQDEMKENTNEEKEGTSNTFSTIAAYYAQYHDIIPASLFQFQKYILGRKRSFALDLTPGLLYASGSAVNGMVESGVSAYCEFKSLLGLHLFMEQQKKKSSKFSSKSPQVDVGITNDNNSLLELSRVPCSKRDVFQTKLLSPVDKRRLMKFLQMASDYAFAQTGDGDDNSARDSTVEKNSTPLSDVDTTSSTAGENNTPLEEDVVTSLNERQLQQGRSLYRPQNKTVSTSDLERLQQCIDDGMDFNKYLEKEHNLPQRLRDIVIYAMAMGSSKSNTERSGGPMYYSTKDGMGDLSLHLRSLGKYGGTAFLVPLYGAGELSQAFCRSAAVHGGTYLLRRGVCEVLLQKCEEESKQKVRGVMLNQDSSVKDCEEEKHKKISAQHVVIPTDALSKDNSNNTSSQSKVFRRISILRGKLIPDDKDVDNSEQRHIIIIPPNTIGNTNVIHGIALDESVNVAPFYYGEDFSTTILHLTTTVEGKTLLDNTDDVLKKAVQSLITSKSQSDNATASRVEEIYQLSFSSNSNNHSLIASYGNIDGLHICQDHSHSITVESAFREASLLFRKICPNSTFLKLSNEMDERVKESRAGISDDDDDHDKTVLESAMNMVTSTVDSDDK